LRERPQKEMDESIGVPLLIRTYDSIWQVR